MIVTGPRISNLFPLLVGRVSAWRREIARIAALGFDWIYLNPRSRQDCTYEAPLWEFGLPDDAAIEVEDRLGGGRFVSRGKTHRIALDPSERSVVIWRLVPPKPFI